jgi:hypothetical protein
MGLILFREKNNNNRQTNKQNNKNKTIQNDTTVYIYFTVVEMKILLS